MIEIVNENRVSAEKLFRDMNEEEKTFLIGILAKERPAMTLQAVTEAVRDPEVLQKALDELKRY